MDPWVGSLAGAVTVIGGAWAVHKFGVRQELLRERRAHNFEAGVALISAMRDLQHLLRAFGQVPVDTADVSTAFNNWSVAVDNHRHRLPIDWHHLPRSVRDAAGTVFGGWAFIHLRPDAGQLQLGEPDAVWQDYADDYIDYASTCLNEWSQHDVRRPPALMSYDLWLQRTGRSALSVSY